MGRIIVQPKPKAPEEDHSFLNEIAKPLGVLGTIGGIVANPVLGLGKAAATAGGTAALAGTAANVANQATQNSSPMSIEQRLDTPIQRRLQSTQQQMMSSPQNQIYEGLAALPKLPQDMQDQYGPTLLEANRQLYRTRGGGRPWEGN